jgi:putative ABC transport system substrate-binding protein
MKRRQFILALAGAAACPLAARAQRGGGLPTVGVLMAGTETSAENRPRIAAFQQGLKERGWIPGQNLRVEYRWSAGNAELVDRYARELVALAPDVILANSTTVIDAFKRVTDSVPIVFALAMDPVGLGHVKSLSHPGGNFTGFTFIDPELIGKWTELLKDLSPRLTRAAVLYNPKTLPMYESFVRELKASRPWAGPEVALLPVGSDGEMEAAIRGLGEQPGGGLIIGPDPFNQVRIKAIAQLAAQNRLPTVSVYRTFAVEGGLMAYGPDTADIFLRAAAYVFSKAPIRPSCRCSSRTSSSSSSTSRPRGRSASTCRRCCSRAPTRSSNKAMARGPARPSRCAPPAIASLPAAARAR